VGRLTDDDLDVIEGRRDQLEGKIQSATASPGSGRKDIDDWYSGMRW
jgi:uncharacterized protein YjbJ (UPF0337 family)